MKVFKARKAIIFLILAMLILFGFIVTKENNSRYTYPPITSEVDYDIMLPSYVPEGYSVTDISINPLFNSVEFTSDSGALYYTQIGSNDATVSLDNEHHTITEYHSEKYEGYLLTSTRVPGNHLLYVWDDKSSYEISGILEKDELIKMLESLEPYLPADQ